MYCPSAIHFFFFTYLKIMLIQPQKRVIMSLTIVRWCEMEKTIHTKDLIFEVAFYKFLENGYENTNLREIASEVNIKAASIYFYFKSKEDLFIYVYKSVVSDIFSEIRYIKQTDSKLTYERQFYNHFRSVITCCINNSSRFKFLLRYKLFPSSELQGILKELYKEQAHEEFEIMKTLLSGFLRENNVFHTGALRLIYLEYKRFEDTHINEMLIGGIISTEEELNLSWNLLKNYHLDKLFK